MSFKSVVEGLDEYLHLSFTLKLVGAAVVIGALWFAATGPKVAGYVGGITFAVGYFFNRIYK